MANAVRVMKVTTMVIELGLRQVPQFSPLDGEPNFVNPHSFKVYSSQELVELYDARELRVLSKGPGTAEHASGDVQEPGRRSACA